MSQHQLNKRLFTAVYANDIDATREAIKDGADINAIEPLGRTPLRLASDIDHTELGNMLIDKGGRL